MYAGHLGVALAAKSARDDVPVWWFVGAALLLEPFEHLLVLGIVVPVVAGLVAWRMAKDVRLGLLIGGVALSHLPLDLVTSHLELTGGAERGLGWYRYPVVDLAVESALIVVGWALYVRRRADPWVRRTSPIGLLVSLLAAQAIFSVFVAPNVV